MPRKRAFSDRRFTAVFNRNKHNVRATAAELETSLVTVYKYAGRLKLDTAAAKRYNEPKSGDRRLVEWYTGNKDAQDLAERVGATRPSSRYKLMSAVSRLWRSNVYPDYPEPLNPSEVQVFNTLRNLDPEARATNGEPLINEPTQLAKKAGLPIKETIGFVDKYFTFQAEQEIEETSTTQDGHRPRTKKKTRTKRKSGKKVAQTKKKSKRKGRRSRSFRSA